MSSGSGNNGGNGGWGRSGSGSRSEGWTWSTTNAAAGDDNYVLRLDKEALKAMTISF